jgi:hypothetical protein
MELEGSLPSYKSHHCIKPVNVLVHYLFKINFNIILISMLRFQMFDYLTTLG